MLVFSGSSNKGLAQKLAGRLGWRLGKIKLMRFADDEAQVWVKEKKIGKEAVVVQSLSRPSDHHLVEFSLMGDALQRLGVEKITAVIPWLAYSRQDKVFRRGEPLSIEVVAKMLQVVPLEKVITVDLHNPEIKRFFQAKLVNLSARSLLVEQFKSWVDQDTVMVAPDVGAVENSQLAAEELGTKLVVINKHRDSATGLITIKGMRGEVKGKRVIIMDDMIAGGGTLVKVSQWLKHKGAREVVAGVTHHLQISGAQEKIDKSCISWLVATDTIEQKKSSRKLKVLSVVDLLVRELK